MKIILVSIFIVLSSIAISQEEPKYTFSERCLGNWPSFEATEDKITGNVELSFIVNNEGHIPKDSIKIIKSIGYGLDKVAIRILLELPKFKEMKKENYPNVRYTLPIKFEYNDSIIKKNKCYYSDYLAYKGNKSIQDNQKEDALNYFSEAIIYDDTNQNAMKYKALLLFKLNRNISDAELIWRKLYRADFINKDEFQKYIKE